MEKITLNNGLRVFFEKGEHLRSGTIGIWVASGSGYETADNNGISHFIEHIVFKGTKTRSAFDIAEGTDKIGASINAFTTKDYTFFYIRALDYHLEEAADILFDMIKNPLLSESDIETEKGVILEEIAMCEDDPEDVCFEENEKAIFDGNSLALPILGTRESVQGFKKEDFQSHLQKLYVPERMVIGVGGSFDRERLLSKITNVFGEMENTHNYINKNELCIKKSCTLKERSFEQNHLLISFPGVSLESEDRFPLQLASFILGMGSSSRLNQRIREQLGLVYSIDSFLGRYVSGGYIGISLSLSPKNEKKALCETVKIINSFPESISEKELAIAKEKLISSLIMSREQPHSKLSSIGQGLLLVGRYTDDNEIINRMSECTLKQIKEASKRYFNLENASFIAVGKVRNEKFYKDILLNTEV